MSRSHWESLLPFCRSEAQERNVKAVIDHGSIVNAAKALGLNRRTVGKSIKIVEKYAASQGISIDRDLTRQTAEGFYAKRISTAYKEDGSVALQWVIQEPERRSIEEKINALLDGIQDDIRGVKEPIPFESQSDDNYLAMYILGDHHFGMLADSETKLDDSDWDVKIATRVIIEAVEKLTNRVNNASVGVLLNVGDFFHNNDSTNLTASGNRLDVDTRIGKTFKLAGRLFQILIEAMLRVHKQVLIINVRGNHDFDMACHLSSCLELIYEKESRVTVLPNYSMFLHYEWGNNLFVFHHGHRVKHEQILQTVVKHLDKEWSQCKNRYCHLGHIHHQLKREVSSMHFEHWGSLVATDQWHDDQGYGAERSMSAVIYHKRHGEDSRVKITMEQLDG
tara:strand:- start:4651 stop:5829 length:1179 start_codon:yes stop_codon:yes gene_type:complete